MSTADSKRIRLPEIASARGNQAPAPPQAAPPAALVEPITRVADLFAPDADIPSLRSPRLASLTATSNRRLQRFIQTLASSGAVPAASGSQTERASRSQPVGGGSAAAAMHGASGTFMSDYNQFTENLAPNVRDGRWRWQPLKYRGKELPISSEWSKSDPRTGTTRWQHWRVFLEPPQSLRLEILNDEQGQVKCVVSTTAHAALMQSGPISGGGASLSGSGAVSASALQTATSGAAGGAGGAASAPATKGVTSTSFSAGSNSAQQRWTLSGSDKTMSVTVRRDRMKFDSDAEFFYVAVFASCNFRLRASAVTTERVNGQWTPVAGAPQRNELSTAGVHLSVQTSLRSKLKELRKNPQQMQDLERRCAGIRRKRKEGLLARLAEREAAAAAAVELDDEDEEEGDGDEEGLDEAERERRRRIRQSGVAGTLADPRVVFAQRAPLTYRERYQLAVDRVEAELALKRERTLRRLDKVSKATFKVPRRPTRVYGINDYPSAQPMAEILKRQDEEEQKAMAELDSGASVSGGGGGSGAASGGLPPGVSPARRRSVTTLTDSQRTAAALSQLSRQQAEQKEQRARAKLEQRLAAAAEEERRAAEERARQQAAEELAWNEDVGGRRTRHQRMRSLHGELAQAAVAVARKPRPPSPPFKLIGPDKLNPPSHLPFALEVHRYDSSSSDDDDGEGSQQSAGSQPRRVQPQPPPLPAMTARRNSRSFGTATAAAVATALHAAAAAAASTPTSASAASGAAAGASQGPGPRRQSFARQENPARRSLLAEMHEMLADAQAKVHAAAAAAAGPLSPAVSRAPSQRPYSPAVSRAPSHSPAVSRLPSQRPHSPVMSRAPSQQPQSLRRSSSTASTAAAVAGN